MPSNDRTNFKSIRPTVQDRASAWATVRGLLRVYVLVVTLSFLTISCSISVTPGTVDPKGEAAYREAWQSGGEALSSASAGFRQGVCDVGGDMRGCYETSARAIAAVDTFLASLSDTAVPSRYRDADSDFRTALKTMRAGFEQRNQGLATNSNGDFAAGNDTLKAVGTALHRAYLKFPVDARPQPSY